IQVVTRDPVDDLTVELSASYGNYDTVVGKGYFSAGLSENTAVDLAIHYTDQGEGWGDNLTVGNEANYSREFAARTKLRWTPSDATNVVFALETIDAYFNTPYRLMPNSTALDGLTAPADFYDARTTFSPGMDS